MGYDSATQRRQWLLAQIQNALGPSGADPNSSLENLEAYYAQLQNNGQISDLSGHLRSVFTGPSPIAAAAGAGDGTGAPSPVLTGNDDRGTVTFGTGTTPSAGIMATVTFGQACANTPVIVLSPQNAATAALQPYVTNISTTGFSVALGSAPAASQSASTYSVGYHSFE